MSTFIGVSVQVLCHIAYTSSVDVAVFIFLSR